MNLFNDLIKTVAKEVLSEGLFNEQKDDDFGDLEDTAKKSSQSLQRRSGKPKSAARAGLEKNQAATIAYEKRAREVY